MSRPKGSIDKDLLTQRHLTMFAYQKEIAPFLPTVRELRDLWYLNTTSAVHLTLQHFVESGLVITRERGDKTFYYAIEKGDK